MHNALINYGGAIDITSYNFLENRSRLTTFPVEFIDWLIITSISNVLL